MRHLSSLPLIGFAIALSGCGGGSSSSTTAAVATTVTIGGTVTGLSGTLVLQDNGGDSLSRSSNGAFTFSVSLQPNSSYDVTIATQPAHQVCSVDNPSGTASVSVTNVTVVCGLSSTATDVWTWVGGSDDVNAAAVYGTQGTASTDNTPGARLAPIAWTDANGNLWLFGGNSAGNAGVLNDLWEYSPSSPGWTWQGGSQAAGAAASYGMQGTPGSGNPGAREGAAAWTGAGSLWLFGGDTVVGQTAEDFNDLWSYDPIGGDWTWVGGATTAGNAGTYGTLNDPSTDNLPPARTGAVTWTDGAGFFWLFGGAQINSSGGYSAVLNDLWSYDPSNRTWTWAGGSDTPDAAGTYGTQGVAAVDNTPAARTGGSVWLDSSGNVWLFGGLGLGQNGTTQEYNDLWEYSPTGGVWTWVSGSDTPNAAGIYGTQRAGVAGSGPGARVWAASWTDKAGNFWLFGGYGRDQAGNLGNLNDLWEYDVGAGVWTWVGGSPSAAAAGTYGAQGVPAVGNTPGAREQAAGWLDSSGSFWLFGGYGLDSNGAAGDLNDLWHITQSP